MCLETKLAIIQRVVELASNWTDDKSQFTILALPVSPFFFLYYAHLWKEKISIDLKVLERRAAQNMHVQVIKDVTIILLLCSINSITCFIRTMITVFWKRELKYFRKMNNLMKKEGKKKWVWRASIQFLWDFIRWESHLKTQPNHNGSLCLRKLA